MRRASFLIGALALAAAGSAFAQAAKPAVPVSTANTAKATFAGGCFWCVEHDFDKVPGVLSTTSGYTGGTLAKPTYEQVSSKTTGHAEAVEIVYDPTKVTYEQLLAKFWRSTDPTAKNRQFCDVGTPYRHAIFTHGDEQMAAVKKSLAELEKSKPFPAPIVTEVVAATAFYPAEEYHQDYANKNPIRYKYYRTTCGRDARVAELWGSSAK